MVIEEKIQRYLKYNMYKNLCISIDHLTGEIESFSNYSTDESFNEKKSKFEQARNMDNKSLIKIAKDNFDQTFEKMMEEEMKGYPSSFYRSHEVGELKHTLISGKSDCVGEEIDGEVNDGQVDIPVYRFEHFCGDFNENFIGNPTAFEFEKNLTLDDISIITPQRYMISTSPIELKRKEFPENYHVQINPRSTGVQLIPEEARRYQEILDKSRDIVKLKPLLQTIAEIANNSILWKLPSEIKDRSGLDRLPCEQGKPYKIIPEQKDGFCLDAGEMIRNMLFDMGFDNHIRVKYHGVTAPIGKGHDVTALYDIENGYSIYLSSKEGNYSHPILMNWDQLLDRFPLYKRKVEMGSKK